MFKNTAGQEWVVFAFQDEGGANPGEPVTGDQSNITADVHIDGGAANAVDDTNPTQLGGGLYSFGITAAESNGDSIAINPVSVTANVNVIGVPGALYPLSAVGGRLDSSVGNMQTDVLTAAAIAAGAMDGKGDWKIPLVSGTSDAGGSTTTMIDAALTQADDVFNGNYIRFTNAALINQTRLITDFNAASNTVTFTPALTAAVGNGIGYQIWNHAGVDMQAINTSTSAAIQLALSANTIENGLFEGTPTTTLLPTNLTETDPDIYIGRSIIVTGGAARGEATDITDYATNGDITVVALANAPAASDPFIII